MLNTLSGISAERKELKIAEKRFNDQNSKRWVNDQNSKKKLVREGL